LVDRKYQFAAVGGLDTAIDAVAPAASELNAEQSEMSPGR